MGARRRRGAQKRRSNSAVEAAAGACGGAVAEPPVVVAVGVAVRACRVRAPAAAGSSGEAAALGAVHARELEPRVDARETWREMHAPHAAELHDEL